MTDFEECIDELIMGLEIGLGTDDAHWSSIEKSVRLLRFLKHNLNELEGFNCQGMEALLLEAIHKEE